MAADAAVSWRGAAAVRRAAVWTAAENTRILGYMHDFLEAQRSYCYCVMSIRLLTYA